MQHYTQGLTNDMLVHIQINGNNMAHCFPKPPSLVLVAFLFLLRELEASFRDCKVWVISLTASAHEELLSSCQRDCVFNDVPHQKSRIITVTKPWAQRVAVEPMYPSCQLLLGYIMLEAYHQEIGETLVALHSTT